MSLKASIKMFIKSQKSAEYSAKIFQNLSSLKILPPQANA